MKTTLSRSKAQQGKNSCSIEFDNLTRGEALALMNALALRSEQSPVCADVYRSAIEAVQSEWPEMAADVVEVVEEA